MALRYTALADRLESTLDLDYPPVAVARVDQRPDSVEQWTKVVPSACSFWRHAEQTVFYADEASHMGCPIGALVMGFELPPPKHEELMSLIGNMCSIAYLREDEVSSIPRFTPGPSGAVYGPLGKFPLEPDNVILWVTPKQAMYVEESLCGTQWTGNQSPVLGRPACAALPLADDAGRATLSMGCIGMRTFTEIPDGYSLVAIPSIALEGLAAHLSETLAANATMEACYKAMKASV